MVGVTYRLAALAIAAIGGIYFLISRSQIGAALAAEKDHTEGDSV